MQKIRNFAWYWLPVILWMFLIFGFSSDSASFQHSSRILEPVLRFLFPWMSEEARFHIVFLARKCAHLTEYAALALLVWRARRKPRFRDLGPWNWREAVVALAVTAIYAATDEYHQTFVPGREGCVRDVIIDTCGAAAGLFLLWLFGRWRKHW